MKNIIKILYEIKNKPLHSNIFTPKIPALQQTMEDERIQKIVLPQLDVIEAEMDDLIFNKIKSCNSLKEANEHFDLLLQMIGVLSRILYVDEIPLSDKLSTFVHDLEISHDPEFRERIFNRIKNGQYNYDFHKSTWGM